MIHRIGDWIWRLVRFPRKTLSIQLQKLWLLYHRVRYALPTVTLAEVAPNDLPLRAPILQDICMPPYFGATDHDDFTPLMKIARSLQPRLIVELGTAHGNTVANLCNQVDSCRVYTVNAPVEMQTGDAITFQLTRDEIGRAYRQSGFGDRVVQIFENTLDLDLSRYMADACVDLAIVDACHDTPYVVNDFLKVKPFVREGGVVLLHDTHPSVAGHLGGSYTACLLLRKKGFDVRHLENTWWAIWENTGE